MNKIVAISMVKNEADVIESFVRYTLTVADELLIVDHMSTDATRKILELLQEEGLRLTIDTYRNPAQLQAEVMTGLMYQAIEKHNADIIVPLDADEFPFVPDDAPPTRAILQALPTDKVYTYGWQIFRPVAAENEQNTFLLNRECYKKIKLEGMAKCFLGKHAVINNDLRLSQGNHHALSGEKFFDENVCPFIYLAHFPWRSEMQIMSKSLGGWLANVMRYSKYTIGAFHWKEKFDLFCKGEKSQLSDFCIDEYEKVDPLVKEKVELRYGALVKTEAMQNVLLVAENIAHSIAEKNTLEQTGYVSVVIFLSGNKEETKDSLESIKKQVFPRIEVFLVDALGNDSGVVYEDILAEYSEFFPIKYLSASVFGTELIHEAEKQSRGEYVQFLFSGDVLAPEKILSMVVGLKNSINKVETVYCDSSNRKQKCFTEGKIPWDKTREYIEVSGKDVINAFGKAVIPPSGYLAGFLVTREQANRINWLADSLVGGKMMLFSSVCKLLGTELVGIYRKNMVLSAQNPFETYLWYQIETYLYNIERHRKGEISDEEFEQLFNKQRVIAEGFIEHKEEIPQDLYVEYLKLFNLIDDQKENE